MPELPTASAVSVYGGIPHVPSGAFALRFGMGQRDSRHHHANRRQKIDKQNASRAQKNEDLEERVPLAGYEALYEISRSGRVYSLKTRAVLVGGYHYSPFIRITVKGAVVTLVKDKVVAESWAAADAARVP
jgi:hypothetical protein